MERSQMVDLSVTFTQTAVTRLKIKSALGHFTDQFTSFAKCFVYLRTAHRTFAPTMDHKSASLSALETRKFKVFRANLNGERSCTAHHNAATCRQIVLGDPPWSVVEATCVHPRGADAVGLWTIDKYNTKRKSLAVGKPEVLIKIVCSLV